MPTSAVALTNTENKIGNSALVGSEIFKGAGDGTQVEICNSALMGSEILKGTGDGVENGSGSGNGDESGGAGALGNYVNAGASNISVPRVIVTGFSTDPGVVMAGSNFKLVIHLRNTSKETRVRNMLFTLTTPEAGEDAEATAPVFLPSSGSNSIYLESIKAGGYADISIELNAKSDLLQKPYSVDLTMVYEDGDANPYESKSSLSIPVGQTVRFEIGEFELSPAEIEVGNETNVMCNIYNMGRVKLYNVKAIFSGEGIQGTETFLGNILPGANAQVDTMLTGIAPTEGPAKVLMTVTYENEAGLPSEMTKEFDISVMEAAPEEMLMEDDITTGSSASKILIPIILIIIVAAAVVTIILLKRRKKRNLISDDEESLLNEIDRPLQEDESLTDEVD